MNCGISGRPQRLEASRLLETRLLGRDPLVEEQCQHRQRHDDPPSNQQTETAAEGGKVLFTDRRRQRNKGSEEGPQQGDRGTHHPVRGRGEMGYRDNQPLSLPPYPSKAAQTADLNPGPPAARVEELAGLYGIEAVNLRMDAGRDLSGTGERRRPHLALARILERNFGAPIP